jgi:hypothetical protein
MQYLNHECIEGVSHEAFQNREPYPWVETQNTLTQQGFERLRQTLPDVELFERRVGVKRAHGQGYHDRYILHYRPDLPLSDPWREFIGELEGEVYQSFLRRMCGLRPTKPQIILTMEWYFAWQGCGVSPHCDARRKLATHIFYFNTETDWQADWGGRILIMDDDKRLNPHSAPPFEDLKVAASLDPRGNGSLLFQRTAHSWHGVHPLEAPSGHLRKLFIITVNVPTLQVLWRRIRGKDPDGFRVRAA